MYPKIFEFQKYENMWAETLLQGISLGLSFLVVLIFVLHWLHDQGH